jgi:predicted membrane-bound spermidine synthase
VTTRRFFVFFCVSGFCSLVYEVVWLRLAMAQYGVTTPLVSIVLSVFMAGLALGSWGAGRLARHLDGRATTLVRLYAVAELAIAASALVVPGMLAWGRTVLARTGVDEWGSAGFYVASGSWVALALLPFCVCMGATFPLATGAIRSEAPEGSTRSFSTLYVANVVGAAAGTIASAFVLIELLGFRGTLAFTASLNAILGAAALLSSRRPSARAVAGAAKEPAENVGGDALGGLRLLGALFVTGLVSMAMEVVWVRLFTPYLGTVVYSFATILAFYLTATFGGSQIYRARARRGASLDAWTWGGLAVASLLPLVFADPRWATSTMTGGALRAAAGIVPFCAGLGFATPLLVDRWAAGDPQQAGTGYAVNVIGCIVGPLLAGFVLLPAAGERTALLLLALPLLALGAFAGAPSGAPVPALRRPLVALGLAAMVSALIFGVGRTFESQFPDSVVRRDPTATVTARGRGMGKRLLVNGIGMTVLVPLTKMMAHLPMAFQVEPPRRALTICFGMGTTFRSTLSWGVEGTAVELVPSVPALFGYFHRDGPQLLASPRARVVIDDGRRFLERSRESFDVIVIDPPPPVEAAGSSLLYSREFYDALKPRLAPHGIVQQWIPGGEDLIVVSLARALRESFPYVRGFVSIQDWGLHLLGSRQPIPVTTAADLARRLPPAAARDLLEWGPGATAEAQFERALRNEIDPERVISRAPRVGALHDDHPINEYYFLRRARSGLDETEGLFVPVPGERLAPPGR